ncbi:MAG TPA: zf-HC2 domain-containing protein [Pirellulales bacterium]|nr:zf-HC2 domain-containing protein [Pirellulales bacterium]
MTNTPCDDLDRFLDDDLSPRARMDFVAHLAECASCSRAVSLEKRIDWLLASAKMELGAVPSSLTGKIERELRASARRRSFVTIGSLAAAIVFFLASGAWITWNGRGRDAAKGLVETAAIDVKVESQDIGEGKGDIAHRPAIVKLTFNRESDAIVIPVASNDPTVSIFWLYPTAPARISSGVLDHGNQRP